jgi:GTP-binding protein
MIIHDVEFIGSFTREDQCPVDGLNEYAFIGRSNVGKSSLINMICGRKDIAHTSSTPGKTQTLNYFKVNDDWYLVDLPGVGYARVSKKMREQWSKMIEYYLRNRSTLYCVFYLIDANVPPQKIDLDFINYLGKIQIPFVLVYTKTDKGKPTAVQKNIAEFKRELKKTWNELPQQFLSSSVKKYGREEILNFIDEVNTSAI